MNKRSFLAALLPASMLFLGACGAAVGKQDSASVNAGVPAKEGTIQNVTVNTTVRTTGQYPESMVVTLDDGSFLSGLDLQGTDFHLTGIANMWGSNNTRNFSSEFSDAKVDGNTLTLIPKDFPEKYFYVKSFKVICDKAEKLTFTEADVSEVITPVADDFETFSKEDGALLDYHLFTPENTENQPAVIVFHGYGDTHNLLTYRTAVEWAEPENQAKRPCYVIAPVIDDATYYASRGPVFEALKQLLDNYVAEGKIDPNRIYVMGNSFGGMSSIEFGEMFPDTPKAILALCPALNYSPEALANIEKIKDIPIWFAHAEHDNTIPVSASRGAVDLLEKAGAKDVNITVFTDEEMEAAGADSSPDSTYSFHHCELVVMEDDTFLDWLYNH